MSENVSKVGVLKRIPEHNTEIQEKTAAMIQQSLRTQDMTKKLFNCKLFQIADVIFLRLKMSS